MTMSGHPGTLPAGTSYFLRGTATQTLPRRLRFNARVNYFSDFDSNQLFSTDIASYSQNIRSYDANLSGAWRRYSLTARGRKTPRSCWRRCTGCEPS